MSPVALWLVPAEPWHAHLAQRIASLAQAHGVEPFEPHVTLHVGEAAEPARLRDRLERLATGMAPLMLRAGATCHSPEHFKTLFIALTDTRLQQLQMRAIEALALSGGYELRPHLSLLYRGGMSEEQREALCTSNRFDALELTFDGLAIVLPPAHHGWANVAGWDTRLRVSLVG